MLAEFAQNVVTVHKKSTHLIASSRSALGASPRHSARTARASMRGAGAGGAAEWSPSSVSGAVPPRTARAAAVGGVAGAAAAAAAAAAATSGRREGDAARAAAAMPVTPGTVRATPPLSPITSKSPLESYHRQVTVGAMASERSRASLECVAAVLKC